MNRRLSWVLKCLPILAAVVLALWYFGYDPVDIVRGILHRLSMWSDFMRGAG